MSQVGRIGSLLVVAAAALPLAAPVHAEDVLPPPPLVATPSPVATSRPQAVTDLRVNASTERVRVRWTRSAAAIGYSVQMLAINGNRHSVKRLVVSGGQARFFQALPAGVRVQACVLALNGAGAAPAVCRYRTVKVAIPSGQ